MTKNCVYMNLRFFSFFIICASLQKNKQKTSMRIVKELMLNTQITEVY